MKKKISKTSLTQNKNSFHNSKEIKKKDINISNTKLKEKITEDDERKKNNTNTDNSNKMKIKSNNQSSNSINNNINISNRKQFIGNAVIISETNNNPKKAESKRSNPTCIDVNCSIESIEDKTKMKKTGSCFKNKTPIDASKLFNSMNNKKKDEMKVNNNEKTSILSNNTLDLNALPHLPNITSQQQQPYLKQKLTQQQSSNQTQLSYQLSKQTQNKQQESQKQILQINIENDQSFFKNHESKAVYNGINNLYSDSGGKTLSKNIESSTKNLQNTLENPKLPMVNDLDPTPLKSSSQKVKTSAITSSINFNDVFSVSGNNKLTPLSMVNANKKINYLMELENLKSEESNPINNLPHTHPVRPFLKPIKLAGDLPFNNDLQPIGEIPLKKTPLSLENIHSSSKTPLHFVQPQISNKQIIPDFNNKNLPPIPNKLSKIQNESPLPILRKTKK